MQPDALGNLEDMLEAISNIEDDTAGITFETFLEERRIRETVQWNFAVIGEAAHRLRRNHPTIAVQIGSIDQIIGFRNAILHGYDRIDYHTVWTTVENRLDLLKADIEMILEDPPVTEA